MLKAYSSGQLRDVATLLVAMDRAGVSSLAEAGSLINVHLAAAAKQETTQPRPPAVVICPVCGGPADKITLAKCQRPQGSTAKFLTICRDDSCPFYAMGGS